MSAVGDDVFGVIVRRKPWNLPVGVDHSPTIWPASLMPNAWVGSAGSSRVVYVPPLRRKPWRLLPSKYSPTIWPEALMPCAMVEWETSGSSRVVQVPPLGL